MRLCLFAVFWFFWCRCVELGTWGLFDSSSSVADTCVCLMVLLTYMGNGECCVLEVRRCMLMLMWSFMI